MTVTRLQHIGIAVADFRDTCRRLEAYFGLHSRDFRDDQGKGMQHDSRVLFGNECWLHVVHNWNPESRVRRFLERHGPGLEHIALETNDIEADVERIRKAGAPIFEDTIFKANDGYEAFVYPDDAVGFTVELIQPHPYSWSYPSDVRGEPLSSRLGIVGLHHVGAIVDDLEAAAERLERLFGLTVENRRCEREDACRRARLRLGNPCWLCLTEASDPESIRQRSLHSRGEGLDRVALQTATIGRDVRWLRDAGAPIFRDRILETPDGSEAIVEADDGIGFTVALIQPRLEGRTMG